MPDGSAAAEARSEHEGAFWSFQPVQRPTVPEISRADWQSNPVDAFLLAKLEAKGLTPVQPADKRTLIRRATYDLIGLPPTTDEVEDFVSDDSPQAFEKVVERLLDSEHYGQRWGRHWLDLVRYADTAGDAADYPVPEAYKYRNYVIHAFNQDKPYDEFIREQIAGDLLPSAHDDERWEQQIATGYIAISRRIGVSPHVLGHITIENTLDNLGKTFLGLTPVCSKISNRAVCWTKRWLSGLTSSVANHSVPHLARRAVAITRATTVPGWQAPSRASAINTPIMPPIARPHPVHPIV